MAAWRRSDSIPVPRLDTVPAARPLLLAAVLTVALFAPLFLLATVLTAAFFAPLFLLAAVLTVALFAPLFLLPAGFF